MQKHCVAYSKDQVALYPSKKPKKEKPIKQLKMLIIRSPDGEILLEKRAQSGIWGGLWSLPELELVESVNDYVQSRFNGEFEAFEFEKIKHVFTHYTLFISPVEIRLSKTQHKILESESQLWYNCAAPQKVGLAAPVKKLLEAQALKLQLAL
jgi:A/G-specific adenine glycosylase